MVAFASGGHTISNNKKMQVDRPFHPGKSSPKKERALRGNGGRRRRGHEEQRLVNNKKLATGPIFLAVKNESLDCYSIAPT